MNNLTADEQFVRKHVEDIYPQLLINERKILGSNYDRHKGDLMHLAIEFFLKKPMKQQLDTISQGKLENFITFIANVQAKRGTTHFYKHYRQHTENSREFFIHEFDASEEKEVLYNEDLYECVQRVIKKLNPFERMLVQEKFTEGQNYNDISARYGIPASTLTNESAKLRDKIKRICQQQ